MSEWELIREIKKRVTDAGLNCRLLKLIPQADKIIEAEDECEFPSGHMVSLLAIGKANPNPNPNPSPNPNPTPSPNPDPTPSPSPNFNPNQARARRAASGCCRRRRGSDCACRRRM